MGEAKSCVSGDLTDKVRKSSVELQVTPFKGEQALTSAIQALYEGRTPKIYFLAGHGEHRLDDFDQVAGYSSIHTVIQRDNVEADSLMLSDEQGIPEDAAGIVIAGPRQKISATEVGMVEDYLNRSGRLFVLLDAQTESGLEPMLRRWGVVLREDIVVDPQNTLRGSDVRIAQFVEHPIMLRLRRDVNIRFFLPRSVSPPLDSMGNIIAEDELQTVMPLCATSEQGWSEMSQLDQTTITFDPDTGDVAGPVYLGVAVKRGAAQDELDVQIEPSKMVVLGDSDFASNGAMVGGNADFFVSALNWLLDRDETLSIAPKPVEEVRLGLSKQQKVGLRWINLGGIPIVAAGLGLIIWSCRRK